ncbi:MAG: UDP-glucose 4-epimerase GalE [Ferrovibrionaceae bacterium]
MRPVVLVTGGAGYIGSHVARALALHGMEPVTYDNLSEGHRWAVRYGPLERGDLADQARIEAVMRQYRPVAVVHLASLIAAGVSVVQPADYYQNNVAGTLALLQAMRETGVGRLVFSSSAAVYGEPRTTPIDEDHPKLPINPYGGSKLMCERMIEDFANAYGVRAASLRYFNAAGAEPGGEIGEAHRNETHLIPLVLEAAAGLRRHVAIFGTDYATRDGTCLRDYVHVCDIADAHLLALRFLAHQPGAHSFNLGSGSGSTVREVVATAERITGRKVAIQERPRRPGDPTALLADPARARDILGWKPRYPALDDQISTAWNWHGRLPSQVAGN